MNTLMQQDMGVDYAEVKKIAIAVSPLITAYPLSNFELGRNQTISLNGKKLPVNEKAYFRFLKRVLRVEPDFIKRFKSVTDEKTELAMLSAMKAGMSIRKDKRVSIIANRATRTVTNFGFGDRFHTHETTLELFERVMNKYKELELRSCFINSEGDLTVTARTQAEIGPTSKEKHRGGISFVNTYDNGFDVFHNALRMVCTNGNINYAGKSIFSAMSEKGMAVMFEKLDHLGAVNWMLPDYFERMDYAMNNDGSVAELEKASAIIRSNSTGIDLENIGQFLPMNEARSWTKRHGIDMSQLNTRQSENCPTGIKLWDIINHVTDFGSHDYGFQANFQNIQLAAGKMFVEKPDAYGMIHLN